jgi:hypothetical protein
MGLSSANGLHCFFITVNSCVCQLSINCFLVTLIACTKTIFMKHIALKYVLMLASTCLIKSAYSQECEVKANRENSPHQRVALIISHTHISAVNEYTGEKKTFTAASVGANYEYWFNSKWAVGLHNDLVMQTFHVEQKADGAVTKREYPLLATLVGIYKPREHWTVFTGPGEEFEKHENFTVIKTGVEYGVPLPKNFEVGFGVEYDIKIKGDDSWLVGVGVSKSFFNATKTRRHKGDK